jgi:hypothetical protein
MAPAGFSWDDEEQRTVATMIAVFGKDLTYVSKGFAPACIRLWVQDSKLLPNAAPGSALRATGNKAAFAQAPASGDQLQYDGQVFTVYNIDDRIRGHFVVWLRK